MADEKERKRKERPNSVDKSGNPTRDIYEENAKMAYESWKNNGDSGYFENHDYLPKDEEGKIKKAEDWTDEEYDEYLYKSGRDSFINSMQYDVKDSDGKSTGEKRWQYFGNAEDAGKAYDDGVFTQGQKAMEYPSSSETSQPVDKKESNDVSGDGKVENKAVAKEDSVEPSQEKASRPSYEDWYKTVPAEKNNTDNYNLKRVYELAPQDQLDAFVNDKDAHLNSVYMNPETGNYEFMKTKNHPTIDKELEWYNGDTEDAKKFREEYELVDDGTDYYQYVKRKQPVADSQQTGSSPSAPENGTDAEKKEAQPVANPQPAMPSSQELVQGEIERPKTAKDEAEKPYKDIVEGAVSLGNDVAKGKYAPKNGTDGLKGSKLSEEELKIQEKAASLYKGPESLTKEQQQRVDYSDIELPEVSKLNVSASSEEGSPVTEGEKEYDTFDEYIKYQTALLKEAEEERKKLQEYEKTATKIDLINAGFKSLGNIVAGVANFAGTLNWGADSKGNYELKLNSELEKARDKYRKDVLDATKRVRDIQDGILKAHNSKVKSEQADRRLSLSESREARMAFKDQVMMDIRKQNADSRSKQVEINEKRVDAFIEQNAEKIELLALKYGYDYALGWARVKVQEDAEARKAQEAADKAAENELNRKITSAAASKWDDFVDAWCRANYGKSKAEMESSKKIEEVTAVNGMKNKKSSERTAIIKASKGDAKMGDWYSKNIESASEPSSESNTGNKTKIDW